VKPILPGSTVGILGGGQLGRMFAIAARRMGYRVHTFAPDVDTPAGQISDVEIHAPYEDLDTVRAFARNVDVVTFEFENVPAATAAAAAEFAPVRPDGAVLHTTQHRLREKLFLQGAGLPLAPFRVVRTEDDLTRAVADLGCPAVLKTAGFGYDGHGQVRIASPDAAPAAWRSIGSQEAVLEAFIDFDCELSVVAARASDGTFVHYGAVENRHQRHILDVTIAPAAVASTVAREAVEIARTVLEKLQVVGVLCVEFFLGRDGALMINELAPRPHNSGHFTFDACVTSQFEQQLRAVCDLPLGSTEQMRPAAMANLLGDIWAKGTPDWASACAFQGVKLHLYGKHEPRPGRKMGHLTALASDSGSALQTVLAARAKAGRAVSPADPSGTS
jgi:5-(carboxyamino)imidazole ribonucleotide synthase